MIPKNKSYLGKKVVIHAYKYNGWLYRSWEFPYVIEETDDYIVLCAKGGLILTSEYKTWRVFKSEFNDFRIWVFFKNEWYNLYIYQKGNNYQYYINISSKYIAEESAIKYVDLDIDFKIYDNNYHVELDVNEFNEHKNKFKYPQKLINIVYDVEKKLKVLLSEHYFTKKFNLNWIHSIQKKLTNFSINKKVLKSVNNISE